MPELVLTGLSVLVAGLLWITARRTLVFHVTPQVECYLRPRDSAHVFELVVANFGMGCAYNVRLNLQADEEDFNSHAVVGKGWPSTKESFALLEPNGRIANLFGMAPSLLSDPPLKPFTATVAYEWKPFWRSRRRMERRIFHLDIRAYKGLIPEWKKDEVAEILKRELPKIAEAVEGLER